MSQRTMIKNCQCEHASASGPRIVHRSVDGFNIFDWVEMACDTCDTPWVVAA